MGTEDVIGERLPEEGVNDPDEVRECDCEEEIVSDGDAVGATDWDEERGVYATGGGVAAAGVLAEADPVG